MHVMYLPMHTYTYIYYVSMYYICHDTTAMLLVSVGLPLIVTTPRRFPSIHPHSDAHPTSFHAQSRVAESHFYVQKIHQYVYIYTCIQYVNIHTSYIHIKMDLSDDRVPGTWFILIMFPNFQLPFRGSKISQRIILLSCLVMSLETYTNNMNLNGKFLSIKNSPTTAYPIYLQQIIP